METIVAQLLVRQRAKLKAMEDCSAVAAVAGGDHQQMRNNFIISTSKLSSIQSNKNCNNIQQQQTKFVSFTQVNNINNNNSIALNTMNNKLHDASIGHGGDSMISTSSSTEELMDGTDVNGNMIVIETANNKNNNNNNNNNQQPNKSKHQQLLTRPLPQEAAVSKKKLYYDNLLQFHNMQLHYNSP